MFFRCFDALSLEIDKKALISFHKVIITEWILELHRKDFFPQTMDYPVE